MGRRSLKTLTLFQLAWEKAQAGHTVVLYCSTLEHARILFDRFFILFRDDPRVHRLRYAQIGILGAGRVMFRSVSVTPGTIAIPEDAIQLDHLEMTWTYER